MHYFKMHRFEYYSPLKSRPSMILKPDLGVHIGSLEMTLFEIGRIRLHIFHVQ